jgi:ribonuclease HII
MNKLQEFEHGEEIKCVCGIDEAGRGPLAGPVFAGCVILPDGAKIEGLNDSKKLSPKRREILYDRIKSIAVAYSFSAVSNDVIDEINIKNATHLAMENAVSALKVVPDLLIADGNDNLLFDLPYEYIIRGDQTYTAIAAASIVAKVERDRLMLKLHEKFPNYGWDKNKGYGTKLHYEAIKKFVITSLHRKSFRLGENL